jgi:hypothetical protein
MLPRINYHRFHVFHQGSFRYKVTSKVNLLPLIKKIHPDFFANETKEIQKTNEECIQNIQELNGQVETLLGSICSHSPEVTIVVNPPFRRKYTFELYVRDTLDGKEELSGILLVFVTPSSLVSETSQKVGNVKKSLLILLQNYKKLWISLNLTADFPWQHILDASPNTTDSSSRSAESLNVERIFGKKESIIEEAFDRAFKKSSLSFYQSRLQQSPIQQPIKRFGKQSGSLQYKMMLKSLEMEIDSFILHKLKLLNGTNEQVLQKVSKFRDFLLNHAPLVNFSLETWQDITILLYEATKEQTEPFYEMKQIQLPESKKTSTLLKIPTSFKTKELISFLHSNVKCSLISLSEYK